MPTNGGRAPSRADPASPEATLRKKAQKMGALALKTLAAIMQGQGQDSVRLAAAREVLDRGHGRPRLGGAGEAGDADGLTVIVKRFSDVTDEEEARADEGEA